VASNNCIQSDNSTPVAARLTDLFDSILPGSSVLPTSLPPGDYTFWIQQVSGDSEYRFLVTSSVPGPLPVLGAAAGFGFSRRLRRRVKQGQGA
jgi:hypothetical protein